jgi:exopolyphosphatase/guanosine-5'-triphosphate,3'-diphosphate pyrophosphatase
MARILAAADIGSNTAHLLVAATDGNLVMRLDNLNEWIPLGEVVARQGEIPVEIQDQLVMALREFKRVASQKQAEGLYVFATEGMRLARNHTRVLKRLKDETGIHVDLISPATEAQFSFRGLMLDCRALNVDLMVEVGGGSAQIGLVQGQKLCEEESLPIGTGRVIAESGLSNPCPDHALKRAEEYIGSALSQARIQHQAGNLACSGGVVRGLWRALHPDGEKLIHLREVEHLAWAVARLPVDRVIARYGVKQKRAGTLLPGALIYSALMKRFGVDQMVISEFGVREGAILEMAEGSLKRWRS